MAGYDSRGFEIPQRFDLRSFPAPRGKRTGPVPAPAQDLTASGGQPFSRVWSSYIRQAGASLRTIRASPAMTGPGIITYANVRHDVIELGFLNTAWALGWSQTPVVEQYKGANTVNPPGQVIVEGDWNNDNSNAQAPPFGQEHQWAGGGFFDVVKGYVIDAPAFYLWFCTEGINANAHVAMCIVNVLNQVPRAALAQYTG